MFHDPLIDCVCDQCGVETSVTPEYKYTDYSGNNGYYDCRDESILAMLDGWKLIEDNKLFCDECADQAEG